MDRAGEKEAMKNKYVFVAVMLLALMLTGVGLTNFYVRYSADSGGDGLKAVTSFYPMYIVAKNIIGGCEGVTLQNLSEPQTGCLHDYQLTAEDMAKLSSADVFIVNGGGIESFLSDVAKQYPGLTIINACEDIGLLDGNAHAWMSIPDYMVQVQTVAKGLAKLDTANQQAYQKNCGRYLARLEGLQRRQQETAKAYAAQNAVIFHEAFDYVARDYGLTVTGSMDLDEERQASAGEVAGIVRQIREHGAKMILAEERYGKSMCETVQKEADVQVAYLNTCVRGEDDADSYLDAMEANLMLMERVLGACGE